MTKEQTLRLAQAVKKISEATNDLCELAGEVLFVEPATGVAISAPTLQLAQANAELLEFIKIHFNKLNLTNES